MSLQVNVNTDGVVVWTNQLEKLNNTAFPNAIRNTLNSLAFDVKKDSMPREADKAFVNRQKNFFKANSRVEMARGNNTRTMESKVGFLATGKTKNNKAVEELEQQEHGGVIKDRSYVPMNPSRVAKSKKRKVAPRNRLNRINIKNIVKTKSIKGVNEGQRFVRAVWTAGKGGLVESNWNGKQVVWRVNSLNKTKGGQFKLTALYSFEKGRSVRVKTTNFMQKASKRSAKRGEEFYIIEAKKQIKKHLR